MNTKLESAIDAVTEGDNATAYDLLRECLREDRDDELAWFWLARVTDNDLERRSCLRQVLRINPRNTAARQELEALEESAAEAAQAPGPEAADEEPEPEPGDDEAEPEPADEEAELEPEDDEAEPEPPDDEAELGPLDDEAELEPADDEAELEPADDEAEVEPADEEAELEAVAAGAEPLPPEEIWIAEEPPKRRPRWLSCLIVTVIAAMVVCILASAALLVPQYLGWGGGSDALATIQAGMTDVAVGEATGAEYISPVDSDATDEAQAGLPEKAADALPGAEALPELAIKQVKIEFESGSACVAPGAELGTTVVVENTGEGAAGAFVIDANGAQQTVWDGLASGETAILWFTGYARDGETVVVVDALFQVEETDKDDNIFAQLLPLPTPPPTCSPPPESPVPQEGTPAPQEGTPPSVGGDVPPADASIANVQSLAPVRITSRSIYSSDPSSLMQFEVDAQGNARIAIDGPDGLEEWYVIDGLVYAGEAALEGLTPFAEVESPEQIAGFLEPFDLFDQGQENDRFTPIFPLHAVLWSGVTAEHAEKVGTETVRGMETGKYKVLVVPGQVPEQVSIAGGKAEDLGQAIAAGNDNQFAYVWIEPKSGAAVKAEWNVTFADGQKGQYVLDVVSVELGSLALPTTTVDAEPTAVAASPEQVVVTYWQHVNEGRLEEAWDMLTPAYQESEYGGSFDDYVQGFKDIKLCSAAANKVQLVRQGSDSATVAARLVVRRGEGCKKRTTDVRFRVLYDADSGVWLINKQIQK